MNEERLRRLLEFLEEDPGDAFTIYAIANEYKETQPDNARFYFECLLKDHPEYLGTYLHAAHLYIELDEPDLAREVYERGIDLAQTQNNKLALRELVNAYNEFLEVDS